MLRDSFARPEIMKTSLSLFFAQRPAVVKPTTAPACRTTSGFGETGTLEGVINAGVKQGKDISSQDFLLMLFSSRAPPAVIKQNVIFKLFSLI